MSEKDDTAIETQKTPAFLQWPSKLFVETTTRCNLRCRMCVKETWDRSSMEGDMSDETFEALKSALPRLDALILNGVGEPLLDSRLEDFIRSAKELMPAGSWVGFQSNGMLLDETRAVFLLNAGFDRICISADALNPETFLKIRRGGEERSVELALLALQNAKVSCNRPDVGIGLEFVLMRDNTRELPDLLRRAASLGATFAIVTHVLPYVESSASQTAFDSNMDGAVELFSEWRKRAASEGLEIGDYFKVLWKCMRPPSDRDLAEFLVELVCIFSSGGGRQQVLKVIGSSLPNKQITIKDFAETDDQLAQLFGNDPSWREALEAIFAALEDPSLQRDSRFEQAEAFVQSLREDTMGGDVNLADYVTVLWKYSRTPREQRLYDLVEEMKAEARLRDISLHLKNLMERDEEWSAELERVFAGVRVVAEETGLALTLPGTSPASRRRCEFVEGGGAFVYWNGNVHPCYFLWHQYGGHFFGRKKFVNAKAFGNVREQYILEIWNSPVFRTFRQEVLAYDFPYCSNCNVVPCQYLTAEEFKQDCYGNAVPCGDCFWCMGMFNCLH